jgi:hypothetical protein
LVARRLIHFSDSFLMGVCGHAHILRPIGSEISYRIQQGHASVVTWVLQVDLSLLHSLETRSIRSRANMDEFAQLQVKDSKVSKYFEAMDRVSLAAHGPGPCESAYESDGFEEYTILLSGFVRSGGFRNQELAAFIRTKLDDKSLERKVILMLEYKLSLLSNDECLEDRLELLRFFVSDSVGLAPPNAVDIMRWRKCGVLRWMVAESFVRLEAPAVSDMQISSRLKYVTFLGKSTIPSSMTVGEFLLLAAIEFDDLQTVQWLVEECGSRAVEVRCNGWNVMHACAHFGRSEIALWFLSQDAMEALLKAPCNRKPADKLFAVHLTVQQGFIFLADQFLEAGCPSQDQNSERGLPIRRLLRSYHLE